LAARVWPRMAGFPAEPPARFFKLAVSKRERMAEPEPQKTTDDKDQRIDEIARVVKDYLREGEAFLVQCQEDEILVEEAPHTKFQRDHPRLYGRLLSLNEQMETGCGVVIALFVVGGVFCLGLHVGWWDDWIDPNVLEMLRTWWFYVPLFVVLFFIADTWSTWHEKRVYRRGRAELLLLLRNEGYDRDTVVPIIQGMPEFEKVVKQLKLDPGPFIHE
jgi:hypothetical protein